MPPGSREMSLRSSASSALTECFVVSAIWRSDTPRRSRKSRMRAPKSASESLVVAIDRAILDQFTNWRIQPRRVKHTDCRDAARACAHYLVNPLAGDATNGEHRK